jgi:pyridoxamine 5'-phosphate oxidase family protein
MFSEQELAFLRGQPLARIGTVDDQGQPTVDAVGFEFDGMRFYMSGHRNAMTNMICAHHPLSSMLLVNERDKSSRALFISSVPLL